MPHGLWVQNVELLVLCAQFINASSVLSKQTAFPREGCPFILRGGGVKNKAGIEKRYYKKYGLYVLLKDTFIC